MVRRVFIHHHLGLGDHFVCNGLVNYAVFNGPKDTEYFLACKLRNFPTVSNMYADTPNVQVVPFSDARADALAFEASKDFDEVIRATSTGDPSTWEQELYDSVNTPFSARWDYCFLPRNYYREKTLHDSVVAKDEPFILVHNESSQGRYDLEIDTDFKIVTVEKHQTRNLLDYQMLITTAKEIHCVNSSFINLVNCVHTPSKIYLHCEGSPHDHFRKLKPWEVNHA